MIKNKVFSETSAGRYSLALYELSIDENVLDEIETQKIPFFNLEIPINVKSVPTELLDPRNTWDKSNLWDEKAKELAQLFISNFQKFCDNDHGKKLQEAGPYI